MSNEPQFTVDWFSQNIPAWKNILHQLKPSKILEIGSFEGRSACFLIDELSSSHETEIHCIDTWHGGAEHADLDMLAVENRFKHNIELSLSNTKFKSNILTHKGASQDILATLLANGMKGYFDFIYVDGSHEAPDVLADAVLSFSLLRQGGVIVFDDYLWVKFNDPRLHPKMAIDAFMNVYSKKLNVLAWLPLYQLYAQKIAD